MRVTARQLGSGAAVDSRKYRPRTAAELYAAVILTFVYIVATIVSVESIDGTDMPAPSPLPTVQGETCASIPTTLRLSAEHAERIAALSKTLGHPVRVQIVELLSRYGGEVCVCEIERHFDLTQPTISHHLRVLREAGVIGGEQRGLWVYYYIQPGALDPLRQLLGVLD